MEEALALAVPLGLFIDGGKMSLLPFSELPPYKPRHFVPAQIDLGDWTQIAPLFDALEKRARRNQGAQSARTMAAGLGRTERRAG